MKKLIAVLFCFSFFAIPSAHADPAVIRIIDKPHLNFENKFRDNELATTLLPDGKLGKLIFGKIARSRTFVIDAALVDEVALMAQGYSFEGKNDPAAKLAAQNWLTQLKAKVSFGRVIVLPYGNPDQKILKSIAPGELLFYSNYAKSRLEIILGRTVSVEGGWGTGASRLSNQLKSDYRDNRRLLTGLSTISPSQEIVDLRARLAVLMNPLLSGRDRTYFALNENVAVEAISNRLRITPGRYQITSSSAKLPITLINNLETVSVVNISLIPLNSRIQIENINNISIAAKSRQQILVPVEVTVSGSTVVLAQLMNTKGQLVGQASKLLITSTVIDSRVVWFTTLAAVLLLLGAITQSVRRFRKSRK